MNEKEIYERLTAVEQSCKSAHHRLDEVAELTQSVRDMVVEVKYMREDMGDIKTRVEVIEAKPAKRCDLIISTVITALCSGIIGFVISQILG